jgi:hypothetical protein
MAGGPGGMNGAINGPHGINGPAASGPNGVGPKPSGVYGGGAGGGAQVGAAQVGSTYGRPSGGSDNQGYGDDYDHGTENYGSGGDYGVDSSYDEGGYADGGYASPDGAYDGEAEVSGDPHYKARRHRPSANDTNVGTLADFAAYGGYDRSSGGGYDRGADERYVQGYDPNGYGRW